MCCKCARWAVPAWLDGARRERGEKQMKYVFIVNPVSGHKDKEAIFNRIRSAFRLIDDEMIVEETDHSGHAREIATAYATKYGDRCVIVC